MRIKSLNIDGYKIFNPSDTIPLGKELQLLIGVNGSGKSTVLEAIAIIFSEVKEYCLKNKGGYIERQFNFSIEYSINKTSKGATTTTQATVTKIHSVFLSSDRTKDLQFTMQVDDNMVTTTKEMYSYLPDNLIFYYSGACNTLENIVQKLEERQAEDLYNKRTSENIQSVVNQFQKNITYIKREFFPLLFALNYIDRDCKLPISNKPFTIHNIVFQIQQPKVTNNNNPNELFGLTGFLRTFLDELLKHSYGIEKNVDDDTPFFSLDYHRGLIETIENLPNLSDEQKYNQTRFLAFYFISLLFRIEFIKEIHISVKDENNNIYKINDFSEGEQQLIVLDAIKKVLCIENSVLFLDEPDAYLHPERQREIIPFIKDIFTESYTQVIATTHSPFVAQSVQVENILLFDERGKVTFQKKELLSYSAIINTLFNVEERFSVTIEDDINSFRHYRNRILQDIGIDKNAFVNLMNRLMEYGEETQVIVQRELAQLKRLKKDFDPYG